MNSAERLVALAFRTLSRFYDHPLLQRPFYRRVHDTVLRSVRGEPRAIVDLGCGTGLLTADLAARFPGARVLGIDLSQDMLLASRRRGGRRLALARANVYALPLRAGSVDLLTSTISYHFYLDPALALREIRRVVRTGGQLILATLATRFLRGNLYTMRLATIADTQRELASAGFVVDRVEHVFPAVRVFVASGVPPAGANIGATPA